MTAPRMNTSDMLRQAKGVLDSITELAARLGSLEREFKRANDELDDQSVRFCKVLRVEVLECGMLRDLVDIVEIRERRRRELEAAVRDVVQTLESPRFPETAAAEARIELLRLLP